MWLLMILSSLLSQDIEFTVDEALRVEYIMLDIVARDKSGNLVTDLQLSDFEIRDQGRAVQPDVFQILDYRTGKALNRDGIELDLPPREFILAIDTESARYEEGLETFAHLKAFVRGLDRDYPFKIKIISLERDSLKPEFVNNSSQALEELKELEERFVRFNKPYTPPDSETHGDMLLFGGSNTVDLSVRGDSDFSQLNETVNHLGQLEKAFIECERRFGRAFGECIYDTLMAFMFQQENRSQRIFGELEKLAYKFEALEGMKTLLFVSAGFAFNQNTTPYELAALYMGRSPNDQSLDQPGKLYLEDLFRRVAHACTKNRVVFHTFNVLDTDSGFQHSMSRGTRDHRSFRIYKGYAFEMSEGLRGLAEESGGRYFGKQDLGPALVEAMEGDTFFYVIGYPAPEGKPGKFHRIKVKAKTKGIKLSHRKGYFGR